MNAELPSMVVPMVEHNAPQKGGTRQRHECAAALNYPEGIAHAAIIHGWQCLS